MSSSPAGSSVASSPTSSHSTTDAFRCRPFQNPRTQDVFQSIVKGRKSWKTLRGGEVVWPPELEAALIEGLENYQPDDSRETRLLGRFPMRNRFISDWIFEKTHKRRTAKQVGSRLQQLRDTCGGKRLLNLLSPHRRPCRTPSLSPEFHHKDGHLAYGPPPLRYESESCSESSASSPTTPTEAHATLQNLLYRGVEPRAEEMLPDTIVYIDLLREDAPISGRIDDLLKTSWTSSTQTAEERSWVERGYKVVRASQHPRHIRDIDPTITLIARSPTMARSHFTVYSGNNVIFSESTPLEPLDPGVAPSVEGALLYKTTLAPGFWERIFQSSDASQYAIMQRVVQEARSSTSSSPTIFSALYKFNYMTSMPTEQHFSATNMLPTESSIPKHDFTFDSLLSMDAEVFQDLGFTKPHNYFDVGPYMRTEGDWGECSPTDSVYSSPMHCNKAISGTILANEQLLSPCPSFPEADVPTYL
ncbi:hypothetical protein B0H34DRAFT_383046 [Crassisporium funariophilum]|nr:hypothetical protein B0H34DRAFT_383046 [Crassisporium funariophilum]